MNDIVEQVLSSFSEDLSGARDKVKNYLNLLASTGKTEKQLLSISQRNIEA
jgi:hypothetical protein